MIGWWAQRLLDAVLVFMAMMVLAVLIDVWT